MHLEDRVRHKSIYIKNDWDILKINNQNTNLRISEDIKQRNIETQVDIYAKIKKMLNTTREMQI
jgi:hypothetical protein